LSGKRSVHFGAPSYVVRKILLPYFVMLAAVAALFIGPIIKEGSEIVDLWFDSVATAIALIGFPILALVAATTLFYLRLSRYLAHFKKHSGRVCFVCNYPLDATPVRCPECGTSWDTEKINKGWKSHLEQAAGDD
jgi:hypothetical protein